MDGIIILQSKMASSNVVRSVQKTGGLFDTALADKLNFVDTKNELDTGDLWEGIDLSMYTSEACGILLDENSLDQFMDLSQFLPQESLESAGVVDIPDVKPVIPQSGKRKRSASVISDHDYVLKKPRVSESEPNEQVMMVTDDESPQPSTSSEDKYKERRRKNNIASRRSREIRKNKFVNMEVEADKLVVENKKLEAKIVEMERLAKEMKAILVKSLVNKK